MMLDKLVKFYSPEHAVYHLIFITGVMSR
uniref:Uncharacterized protein n=1 Tax=Rhizophora mucronata TaxID=61149 RepID=A0A2P2N6E6_RHIMU